MTPLAPFLPRHGPVRASFAPRNSPLRAIGSPVLTSVCAIAAPLLTPFRAIVGPALALVHGLHKVARLPLWSCYGLVGGLLVSHDVHFNAAFAEFVARTHARDKNGVIDAERTTHHDWGRWGYIGFVIKKAV